MNSLIDESTDDSRDTYATTTTTNTNSRVTDTVATITTGEKVNSSLSTISPHIHHAMSIATIASSSSSSLSQQQEKQQIQSNDSDQYQVQTFLASCNLSQYYNLMIQEGFDQLEALFEVTEIDLEQMGVKRGHRRLLQRAIANNKRKSIISPLLLNNNNNNHYHPHHQNHQNLDYFGSNDPSEGDFTRDPSILLTSPKSHPFLTRGNLSHHASVSSMSLGGSTQTSSSNDEDMVTSENINKIWKRRYRRKARIDNNAPKKPPSAYVMFSNDIRMELKEQNLSFTTLSKITGDRWKNLEPNERKFYEIKADYAKDDYILAQAKYQLTDEHKQYQQYLSEFRMRHASSVNKPRKRLRSIEQKETDPSPSPCESMISDPPAINESAMTMDPSSELEQEHDPSSIHANSNMIPPPPQETRYPYWLLNDNTPSTPIMNTSNRPISTTSPSSSSFLSNMSDVIYPNQQSQSEE
ncbi:hypothetical protein INT45_003079 [Circinella minor]|uniref:HMG box domain-containing protein n=1 Tax=Circinella minor TaxID=1195481 RepID=A0A8H7RW89_9FUNG|nr:hypothetical protein INT45_003079 [Circinella minor]